MGPRLWIATWAPGALRRLGRAAPSHLRPLLAERGVGERLQGFVQRGQLVRDADEPFGRLEAPVEGVHLVAEAVEALEDGIELAIIEVLAIRHYG